METVKDKICGMEVEKDKAVRASYKAKTFYFCSDACKEKFTKEPERYVRNEDPECY